MADIIVVSRMTHGVAIILILFYQTYESTKLGHY